MTEKYISAELLTEKNGLYLLCIKGGLVQKWWIFHFRAKKQMRRTDEKRPSFLRTYAYVQKCVSESFGWWGAYCVRFPALTMERKLLLLVIFLHLFQLYLHSADFHSGVFLLFFFTKLSILHKTLSSVVAFRLATRQRVSYALFSVMRLFTWN